MVVTHQEAGKTTLALSSIPPNLHAAKPRQLNLYIPPFTRNTQVSQLQFLPLKALGLQANYGALFTVVLQSRTIDYYRVTNQ